MKKQEFLEAMNKVNLSEDAQKRIMIKTMKGIQKKECIIMSKKKIGFIAVAATFIMCVAVYAASGIISSWSSHSYSTPGYTSIPSEQECINDIGYAPVLIESFENGYVFKEAYIVSNDLKDDSDKSVEKFKSITMNYTKNNDELILSACRYDSEIKEEGRIVATIDGSDLFYSQYNNKLVPPDYKLTDEDKKAEKSGELVFSYGASEVSVSKVQGLSWEKDGIHYNFTTIDGTLTMDELVNMAGEIINK